MDAKNMKYDENDIRAIQSTGRLDANEGVFFARQLEFIKSQSYDVKRAKLSAMEVFPVSTATPEGATTITYRQYDQVGMAKIIANYADDLPRADVSGKEFTSPIRGIGVSYGYNMQEIRSAMYAGTSLSERKMRSAQRAHEEKINQFELEKIEEIILSVAKSELKHIEVLGGVLGAAIGLFQAGVMQLFW